MTFTLRNTNSGEPLVVQRLGFWAFAAKARVQSLVKKRRSYKLYSTAKKERKKKTLIQNNLTHFHIKKPRSRVLLLILLNPKLGSPNAEPQTWVWSREKFSAGPCRKEWLLPQTPKLPKELQQSTFKGKVKRGCGWLLQISWCQNPLFLQLFLQKTNVTVFIQLFISMHTEMC